jgi:hypothetical protein
MSSLRDYLMEYDASNIDPILGILITLEDEKFEFYHSFWERELHRHF